MSSNAGDKLNIKQKLKHYRYNSKELVSLKQRIEALKDRQTSIRSTSDFTDVIASTGNSDKIGELIAKIVDLQQLYYEKMLQILDEQKELESMIECLDPDERLLIRLYYSDGYTWEEVAVYMGYTWRHIHRLHSKILEKLNGKIGQ